MILICDIQRQFSSLLFLDPIKTVPVQFGTVTKYSRVLRVPAYLEGILSPRGGIRNDGAAQKELGCKHRQENMIGYKHKKLFIEKP